MVTYLEDGLVASVNQLVCLQRVALSESLMTDIANVWFFACRENGKNPGEEQGRVGVGVQTCMNSEMSLQLVGVGRGVGAVGTLVGAFAGVAAHMPLQFGQLHRGVVALVAPVRLLVRVPVTDVAHQFARSGERRVAELALVRSDAGVGVDVVLQRCQGLRENTIGGDENRGPPGEVHTLNPRSQMPHLWGRSSLCDLRCRDSRYRLLLV